MMKEVAKFESCVRFFLSSKNILWTDSEQLFVYDDKIKHVCTHEFKDCEFIGEYKEKVYIRDGTGKGYQLSKDFKLTPLYHQNNVLFYNSIQNNLAFVFVDSSPTQPHLSGIYDINTDSVIFMSKECKSTSFYGDLYLGKDGDTLYSSSLKDGSLLWEYSIKHLPIAEFRTSVEMQVIGVYESILWLRILNCSSVDLIGLDSATGKAVHELWLGKTMELQYNWLPNGDVHLDATKGVLKSLSYHYYWELDLHSLKGVVKKDFGDSPTSWDLRHTTYDTSDNNLYFVGTRVGGQEQAIGIFDTLQCKVTWFHEPQLGLVFFPSCEPQWNGTYLAVKDMGKVLRIYGRD